jgi:hypothetical protein
VKNVPIDEYESRQKLTVATKLYNSELIEIFAADKKQSLIFKTNKKEIAVSLAKFEIHKKNVKGSSAIKLGTKEKIESVTLQ